MGDSLTVILIVSLGIILLNMLSGYWRSNTRRFSLQWLTAIHAPVIIIIGSRITFLGWHILQLPFSVVAFTAGQYFGGRIRQLIRNGPVPLGSFLIADLAKVLVKRHRTDT